VRGLNWFSFLCTLLEHLPLKFAFNSIVKPLLFTYYILLWSCRTELSFQDIFMSSTRKKKLGSKWKSRQSVWFSSFFFIKISKVWWPKGFYLILQKEGFFLSSNWPIFVLNGKKWEKIFHTESECANKQKFLMTAAEADRPPFLLQNKSVRNFHPGDFGFLYLPIYYCVHVFLSTPASTAAALSMEKN